MSTTTDQKQPALIGGLVLGVLSALPLVSAGNFCCCLWVIGGGVVAAYLLQQARPAPISPGEGALVGLLSGIVGAVVYLILSIPITILIAPLERVVMQRVMESAGPGFRQYLGTSVGGGVRVAVGFFVMLVFGSMFSTAGGVLGAFIFGRTSPTPPAEVHEPPGAPSF